MQKSFGGGPVATLSQEDLDRLTLAFARDPRPYLNSLLYIRPKQGGKLVPFQLTKPQLRLANKVKELMDAGIPVRIIILKARQLGFSTEIQGLQHWFIQITRQVNALTMAHKSVASKNLLQIFLRYQDSILSEFRPMVKGRNENVGFIEFGNPDPSTRERNPGLQSKVSVETAEAPDAGRSGTVQFLHGSEVAFYPNRDTLNAMLQAVPDIGAHIDENGEWNPGTFVFLESTGNGAAGDFYDLCQAARRGENDFVFFFVAWWEQDEYRKPVIRAEEEAWRLAWAKIVLGSTDFDNSLLRLTAEEIDLAKRYNLDFGQIKWRRSTIATKCKGDVALFKQEYPSNPDEAFLASGSPWFDTETVVSNKEAAVRASEPERYRIDEVMSARTKWPVILPDPYGELYVWRKPDGRRRYVIGADVAEGKEDGDNDVAQVLDHEACRQVAKIRGLMDTDKYTRKLYWLGMWYNKALLGPENNSMGAAVVNILEKELHYPNLYGSRHDETDVDPYEWGWRTNVRTRPIIVSRLQQAVRDHSLQTDNLDFWDECLTFVRDEKGTPRAQSGRKDDEVMAMAITLEMREHMPGSVRVATGGRTTPGQVHPDLAAQRRAQLPV